jgi:hypothetical protein
MPASTNFEVKRTIHSKYLNTLKAANQKCLFNTNYLSFSVPKIDAKYSAMAGEFFTNYKLQSLATVLHKV